jgi:chromosome segregation ATPase
MVFGIFGAVWRYVRAIGYFLTGNVDAARKSLSHNPYVVRATYDNIIETKRKRAKEIQEAVSGLTVQEAKKLNRLKELTEESTKLEKLRSAAVGKAKELADRLQSQGSTPEQVKSNAEYTKWLSTYQDYSSTLERVTKNIADIESDVKQYQESANRYKVQLTSIKREIDNLAGEKEGAVADIVASQEEKNLNDAINGISNDNSARELAEMREIRERARAEAKVGRELAGTESRAVEEELLDFASKNSASSEFDEMIGLKSKQEASEPVKLPEA